MQRIGVLVGVSSDVQARDDRASIPDQIKTCREFIQREGAIETALYVMDGYSRTGYESLPDAMRDIPPLAKAIEDAGAHKYDVLLLDNWERLGNLGQLVLTRMNKHKIRIHSVRQSGSLPKGAYDPDLDESSEIDMYVEGIIDSYRKKKLKRGKVLGIRREVENGRYSTTHPKLGYKRENGKVVLDAPVANLLIECKDLFLRGASTTELADYAEASGIKPPGGGPWYPSVFGFIFRNPFYAGYVFRDRWKTKSHTSDAGHQYRKSIFNPHAELYPASHPALWTREEYVRMKDELEERYHFNPRYHPSVFSGLLLCPVCGKRAQIKRGMYACKPRHPGDLHIPVDNAPYEIGEQLVRVLTGFTNEPEAPASPDVSAEAIREIDKNISMIQSRLERGIYTEDEAADKIASFRAQKRDIEAKRLDKAAQLEAHKRLVAKRDELLPRINELPHELATRPPKEANRFLRDLLRVIEVHNGTYVFIWR